MPDDYTEYRQSMPYGTITMPFDLDMTLSADGIKGMLDEYEADHQKCINTAEVALWIREYTGGYPFLVSRICQLMDEQNDWSHAGFLNAKTTILHSKEDTFEELKKNINEDSDLRELLEDAVNGNYICYMPYAKGMIKALDHDYIVRKHTPVQISSPMLKE